MNGIDHALPPQADQSKANVQYVRFSAKANGPLYFICACERYRARFIPVVGDLNISLRLPCWDECLAGERVRGLFFPIVKVTFPYLVVYIYIGGIGI